MINIIDLKTDPELFEETFTGRKTFEIRINDRNYQIGDILVLHETMHSGEEMVRGKPLVYTGRVCDVKVTNILNGGYGLSEGWVVMSTNKTWGSDG